MSALHGIAALLLQRGCPEERLDEALAQMTDWPLPSTLADAVAHVDRSLSALGVERA